MAFEYDVFISYTHNDNEPYGRVSTGWIDFLHEKLRVKITQLLGQPPRIWRDSAGGIQGNSELSPEISRALRSSIALLSVLTPSYLNSKSCPMELQEFLATRDERDESSTQTPVFKVIKTFVELDKHPEPIRNVLGYQFFSMDKAGKFREFEYGENGSSLYWQKLDDLAFELTEFIKTHRGLPPARTVTGSTVFLAETTPDVSTLRDGIRRQLEQWGHRVVPELRLSLEGPELRQRVQEELEKASLSIHLLGADYGVVPNKETRSIPDLQHQLAAQKCAKTPDFTRLVWLDRNTPLGDDRQGNLVNALRQTEVWEGHSELLEVRTDELLSLIRLRLEAASAEAQISSRPTIKEAAFVYLVYDKSDSESALLQSIQHWLFERNIEILTLSEDNAVGIEEHEQNLKAADGVVFFVQSAGLSWLKTQQSRFQRYRATSSSPVPVYLLAGDEDWTPKILTRLGQVVWIKAQPFERHLEDFLITVRAQ